MPFPKHKPRHDNEKATAYRSVKVHLPVTEDQAKAIMQPILDTTAYFLSIERVGEMPQLQSLQAAFIPVKNQLAMLLGQYFGVKMNPADLSISSGSLILKGGYFTVDVKYFEQRTPKPIVRDFNVVLQDRTGTVLIRKIQRVIQAHNPSLTDEELTTETMRQMEAF